MNFQLMAAIATFSFVTSISPGPNNTFLLASGANFGIRKSLPYVNGIMAGLSVMLLALGAGLGLVFTNFPILYQILKYVGFAYIIYLAYRIIRSTSKSESAEPQYVGFFQSALFQFLNPKAWIVSASFMATYMPLNLGIGWVLLACALFLIFTYPGAVSWAVFGQSLKGLLSEPRKRKVFNIFAAVLLVATMIPVLFI